MITGGEKRYVAEIGYTISNPEVRSQEEIECAISFIEQLLFFFEVMGHTRNLASYQINLDRLKLYRK